MTARSGARVVALDRFAPGMLGAAPTAARAIRKAHFEHVSYVPLLERSYLRWTELDAKHPETLLDLCGVLQVGPAMAWWYPVSFRRRRRTPCPSSI